MADQNAELLRENGWPARKFILIVMILLYLMVMGVMAYEYCIGAVGRLAPRFVVSAAMMAACFAFLFFVIAMNFRPHGKWSVSEQGLRFLNASDDRDWRIPWDAIRRMKYTSLSLVIWWTEAPVNPVGASRPHREVLFVDNEQARGLIATWHSRTRTPARSERRDNPTLQRTGRNGPRDSNAAQRPAGR